MKRAKVPAFLSFLAASGLLCLTLSPAPSAAGPIQDAIDAARPGDIVTVPAGIHKERIVLKEGVALVGAGAESTVLDGDGGECVVTARNDSLVAGFTIRNAKTGVTNDREFIGVFDCRIVDFESYGVHVRNGSSVVANNTIDGAGRGIGVYCYGSNPLLAGNTITRCGEGVRAFRNYDPVMVGCVVTNNTIGVRGVGDAVVALIDSDISSNTRRDVLAQSARAGADTVLAYDTEIEPGDMEGYLALMEAAFVDLVARHPVVTYDLGADPGAFDVTTRFPWATFGVGSCTSDTVIASFAALDAVSEQPLNANLETDKESPRVFVINKAIRDEALDRYVLDARYCHPPSYRANDEGELVFKRTTDFSNIEVLAPAGYLPTAVNEPATFDRIDGRVLIRFVDVGMTDLEIVMAPAAEAPEDPFGLLVE